MKSLISIVIPLHNEQEVFFELLRRLTSVLKDLETDYIFEIIFIDDGSRDATWDLVEKAAMSDARIKGNSLSRNFGHQKALAAGYNSAKGDAIITMDGDLQDPPELIGVFLKEWENGFKIVYARRTARTDGFLKRTVASCYYWFLHQISSVAIARNVGDFRLIDREVLGALGDLSEASLYWRGAIAWTGLSFTFVDFKRPNRHAGIPSYTWGKSLQLGLDGIFLCSSFLLHVSLVCAAVGVVVVCCMIGVGGLKSGNCLWTQIAIMSAFSMQFACLWIVGAYMQRIYDLARGWPLYVVKKRIGPL